MRWENIYFSKLTDDENLFQDYIQEYKLKPFDKDNHFLYDFSEEDEQIKSIKDNRSFNNFLHTQFR